MLGAQSDIQSASLPPKLTPLVRVSFVPLMTVDDRIKQKTAEKNRKRLEK